MTIVGFLPQRWRPSEAIARHSEAIAGVLHTAPVRQTAAGPMIASLVGTADVLPYLVAIKSLFLRLGRGRIAIVDDGTLTGEDRAILAHHCGDPEIVPHQTVRRGAFPADASWALPLTILDRRSGQYWIALDPHTVTLAPVAEVEAAVASNRSFGLAGGAAGIAGFAAGGAGRHFAASLLTREPALSVEAVTRCVLTAEPATVELPRKLFAIWRGKGSPNRAALMHFPSRYRFIGEGYAAAGAAVIAGLPC